MSTVDLPVVGSVDKRVAVAVGVGTAGAIALILWRRRTAAAADQVLPADEGDLTDTGEYGGGSAWQYAATPTGDVSSTVDRQAIPTTNAEWGTMALDALEGAGYDRNAAATAVGAYQAQQYLTAAQAIMIRAAIALVGPTPAGSLTVRVQPTTTATPTTKPVSTAGYRKVTLGAGGVLAVGKKYGFTTTYLMSLPINAHLRGLTTTTAIGRTIYVPSSTIGKKAS